MRLRVRLRQTVDNVYVDLPTYILRDVDLAHGLGIVDVPVADLPPLESDRFTLGGVATLYDHRRFHPSTVTLALWHAHLDARYREHAGRFRPTIV